MNSAFRSEGGRSLPYTDYDKGLEIVVTALHTLA